jgi:hypothetical protein
MMVIGVNAIKVNDIQKRAIFSSIAIARKRGSYRAGHGNRLSRAARRPAGSSAPPTPLPTRSRHEADHP